MSDKKGVSPLATGVAGAIIGAAAAAAAVALSDEKNKKKAEDVLKRLEREGNNILRQVTVKALKLKDAISTSLESEETQKKPKAK